MSQNPPPPHSTNPLMSQIFNSSTPTPAERDPFYEELLSPEITSSEFFSRASAEVFKNQAAGATAKIMLKRLNDLVQMMPDEPASDRALFHQEMQNFYVLFQRYLAEKVKGTRISWDLIKSPAEGQIIPYKSLDRSPVERERSILDKLAVLKLNGGLGATMGCVGPKSAIEVRDGMTFLDLTVRQIEHKNAVYGTDVPLILMNSFNTDTETKSIIKKYEGTAIQIHTFNQSRYPRISKDSLLPVAQDPRGVKTQWYPPGHGDIFSALSNSGMLDKLLAEGKEYLFVSNIDNLGATVDTTILHHFIESGAEFIMEVTDKTKADVKGGTLINYQNGIRLLEIAQVPPEHVEDFKSIKKFKIFNTNNMWISLKAIKRVLSENELDMEIIVNVKTDESTGEKVIQLETAAGASIKHFGNAHGINVPRSRFLPVKSCSDLFIVQSDLYELVKGELIMNTKRLFGSVPIVKLGEHFKKVQSFLKRFKNTPKILELDHLTVAGDVYFGSDVTLKGTVIIVANQPSRIDIPSGSVLEDKVITGDLRILDH